MCNIQSYITSKKITGSLMRLESWLKYRITVGRNNPYLMIIRHCHSLSYYKYTAITMKTFLLRIFKKLFVHNSCHVLCLIDVCSDLWGLNIENFVIGPNKCKEKFSFFCKELEISLQTSTNLPHLLQNCKQAKQGDFLIFIPCKL